MIEGLVEQIEARYADAQAQMSDPEVIGDRTRYADAGREYRQLEPAAKLAQDWPVITDKREPLPDADAWATRSHKRDELGVGA